MNRALRSIFFAMNFAHFSPRSIFLRSIIRGQFSWTQRNRISRGFIDISRPLCCSSRYRMIVRNSERHFDDVTKFSSVNDISIYEKVSKQNLFNAAVYSRHAGRVWYLLLSTFRRLQTVPIIIKCFSRVL